MDQAWLSLAASIGDALTAKNWHICCAESCTGGGVAYALTSKAGSSAWFNQSYVTYSNAAKEALVGVNADTLMRWGAVSQQTVLEMARGCADNSKAQVGVAVSGIAGPDGGTDDKPVGTVWFGFFVDGGSHAFCQHFTGDRHEVRRQSIHFCLQKVLQLINNQ